MKSAYNTSQKIFEQVSMRTMPEMYDQLKGITKGEIVVVEGAHDHIEKLLDTMKIPYSLIQSEDLDKNDGGRVLFLNCASYEDSGPASAVRNFAKRGGRVISTDWSVDLITQAFPGKIKKTDVETEDDVVEIQFANELGRKLIGLNYVECHPKWWLEGSSYVYKITGKDVVPIITSKEMERKYGEKPVLVGFPFGEGEVFHFISHLELQRTHAKNATDKGTLEDFLKNVGATKTSGMDNLKVAELESAYSTLNTLAYMCLPQPYLSSGDRSISFRQKSGKVAVKLLVD